MNYTRIAIAAVAAWVADMIYGFIVYGNLLTAQFEAHPGVFRASAGQNLPLLFAGLFVGILALAAIYAKGYEGGNGIAEGIRFGVLIAIVMLGFVFVDNYVLLNLGRRIAASLAIAGMVEMVLIGAVVGATYKPAAAPVRARATTV